MGITTLLERRARGDLIKTFKIYKGFANSGSDLFRVSRSGYNILYPTGRRNTYQHEFLNTRIIEHWNKLPHFVKDSSSVDVFECRLENYRKTCLSDAAGDSINYWTLSDILLSKIDDSQRSAHVEYLVNNPGVAKYKRTNILHVD